KAFLTRHTLHVSEIDDFAHLGIPFIAVATDISTGEPVELTTGNLAEAMFASVAIPAFIGPILLDGQLLVDGGVANNLPVDIAKTMDPDIIIAVDLSSQLRDKDVLLSVLDLTDQLTSILTRKNTEPQIASLKTTDILIVPEIENVTSLDFELATSAIPLAYRATMDLSHRFRGLSLSESEYQGYLANLRRTSVETLLVQNIEVITDSTISPELLANKLHIVPGPIAVSEIEAAVDELYGLELFSQVPYQFRDGKLLIKPQKRDWGPNYLQFGLGLHDNFQGRNHYNLGVALTLTERNAHAGEWRTKLNIGERPLLSTEWFQPLGKRGNWFVNPGIAIKAFNRGLFDADNLIAEYQIRQALVEMAVGYTFGPKAEVRLDVSYGEGIRRRLIGDPAINTVSANTGLVTLGVRYDSLDSLYFPRQGKTFDAGWIWSNSVFGADANYRAWRLSLSQAFSITNHTLLVSTNLNSVYRGEAPFHEQFTLGGFLNLSGLEVDQKVGQHKAIGRLVYSYRWLSSPILPAYVGATLETGQIWQDKDDVTFSSLELAGSLFLGLDSPIGPIYLAAGLTQGGTKSIYVYLGQPF
ncbi:MAG: patatin-like phospholipase family protein, partial [Gammaproteobacteria bacterium]|nr:patatin-like phospholipase family protein [Gammaproteobacteria bacterium]